MFLLMALSAAHGVTSRAADARNRLVDFNRDVRPILSDTCFACHGPDGAARRADLRLDSKSAVFDPERQIVVPGYPDKSYLYQRITATDADIHMPPASTNKTLSEEQIATIRKWIETGAQWSEHWAFQAPVRPEPPTVQDASRVRNPIDQFILNRLDAEGLKPSPEADRRTLIRRLALDLTGLPPTREEVNSFLADDKPDAYERLVEHYLAKPQYGEHLARYWLDAARYGDTHGLHLDNYREMWPYRDWVIGALNENMPFDQFTVEQLAGDLLPDATLAQKIASGFNRCNVSTSEGGSIDEEYYVRYAVDRVNTTSTVWLGLTSGCAQCHDHKYDPLTQKEFYGLFAYFNNLTEKAMDGNTKNPAPVVKVPTDEQTAGLTAFDGQIAEVNGRIRSANAPLEAAQSLWSASLPSWTLLTPQEFVSKGGAKLDKLDDGSLLASGENPAKETYEVTVEVPAGRFSALRLDALNDASLPNGSSGRSSGGNAVLTEFEAETPSAEKPDEWTRLRFVQAWADYEQAGGGDFAIAYVLDGKAETGWATGAHQRKEDRQAVFVAAEPFGGDAPTRLRLRLKFESPHAQHQFGRFRFEATNARLGALGSPVALSDWHSVGPFAGYDAIAAFYEPFEPEGKGVNLGQEFKVGDQSRKWIRHEDWLDGDFHAVQSADHAATYLYRNIQSDTRQRVTLTIDSEDAVRVWVNRQEVWTRGPNTDGSLSRDRVQALLQSGGNELVIKLVNDIGGSGLAFGIEAGDPIPPLDVVSIAALSSDARTPEQATRLTTYYREQITRDPQTRRWLMERSRIQRRRNELDAQIATTLVMEERTGERRPARLLKRGQYDQPGDPVEAGTPGVLPPIDRSVPQDRLALARWLLREDHPLTSRVTVNRPWQQVFGRGIVRTSEDFGSQGDQPSHPELLDWLATEFMQSGWDVKHMLRLMVTSATYRQSSSATPELIEKDPRNRLYARGPRFRLDAEAVRDQALALSGLLQPEIGGPSVKPPQPDGLWEAVGYVGSNTANFKADEGSDKVHRRSLYTFWKRTSPPPEMSILDAPSRESCAVRRERTNTPLQALMLMNDPQYFEAARAFAERILKEGGATDPERIRYAFETATSRKPGKDELATLTEALASCGTQAAADVEAARKIVSVGAEPPKDADPVLLATWTMIAQILLNLDEVITKG